jgi:hypothetical protein
VAVDRACLNPLRSFDEGGALVLALLVAAVGLGIGLAAGALADTETISTSAFRDGVEAFYVADGALEAAQDELAQLPDWSLVLSGLAVSRLAAASQQPTTALSGQLDLAAATVALQAQTDAGANWGANNPRWRLYAWGPLSALWAAAGPNGLLYVAVWVADDVAETDGNPLADSNGCLRIRAEARGRRGSRRIVEAVLERVPSTGVVRQVSWREVR